MTRPLPTTFIDYTSRDFDSVKRSLVAYVRQKFPNDFTDLTESQLGVAILELIAYTHDILSYSLDRNVNEMFLATARTREAVIRLTSLLGYKMAPATAASVDVFAETAPLEQYSDAITLTKGEKVNANDIVFELAYDYTINKVDTGSGIEWVVNGSQNPFILLSLIQGETHTEAYTADGGSNYVVTLQNSGYINGSMIVSVGGTLWTIVDSLVLGNPVDPEDGNIVEVLLDSSDTPSLKFGDGTVGTVPSVGTAINVTYRTGGGESGNVAAGSISASLPALVGGSDSISVRVSNEGTTGSGGADRESIEHARIFAPQWAKTTDRAVTYNDYIALSTGYTDGATGRVEKAGVIADPTDGLVNQVSIYIWTKDGNGNITNVVSNALKNSLWNFLEARRSISVYLAPILSGDLFEVDVSVLLSVRPDYSKASVQAGVEQAIKTLFKDPKVVHGNELRLAWLYDTISNIAGVRGATVTLPYNTIVTCSVPPVSQINTTSAQTGVAFTVSVNSNGTTYAQDHWRNYYVIVYGQGGPVAQKFRILASTPTVNNVVVLTVDKDPNPSISQGMSVTITHPRKVRLTALSSYSGSLVGRRIVFANLDPSNSDRGIVDFDQSTGIATLDKNVSGLVHPNPASITPDFRVDSTKAISLGTLTVTTEAS